MRDCFRIFFGHRHCAGLCKCWCLVAIKVTRGIHSQDRERDVALDFGLELDVDVQVHVESNRGGAMATVVVGGDLLSVLPMRAGDLVLFWCEFVGFLPRQLRVGGVARSSPKRQQIGVGLLMLLWTFRCVWRSLRPMRMFIALGVHFECLLPGGKGKR